MSCRVRDELGVWVELGVCSTSVLSRTLTKTQFILLVFAKKYDTEPHKNESVMSIIMDYWLFST